VSEKNKSDDYSQSFRHAAWPPLITNYCVLCGTPELTEIVCKRNFLAPGMPDGVLGQIENAANARKNEEPAEELYRQLQAASDVSNSPTWADRFFSFCTARIAD
jgi:hypothetical protein